MMAIGKREPRKRRKAPEGPIRQNPTQVAFVMNYIKERYRKKGAPKEKEKKTKGPVCFRAYYVSFLSLEDPETYASVGPGVKHLRSRRFLGLFCSFSLSSEDPETYASVGPGVKHIRSCRCLGLFCPF